MSGMKYRLKTAKSAITQVKQGKPAQQHPKPAKTQKKRLRQAPPPSFTQKFKKCCSSCWARIFSGGEEPVRSDKNRKKKKKKKKRN